MTWNVPCSTVGYLDLESVNIVTLPFYYTVLEYIARRP